MLNRLTGRDLITMQMVAREAGRIAHRYRSVRGHDILVRQGVQADIWIIQIGARQICIHADKSLLRKTLDSYIESILRPALAALAASEGQPANAHLVTGSHWAQRAP